MAVSTEIGVLATIMFILAGFTFLNGYLPDNLKLLNNFDFLWFGGGIVGVAGTCVVLTGIPCAAGLGLYGIGTLLIYVFTTASWFKALFILPVTVIIVYIISKLGRGGG